MRLLLSISLLILFQYSYAQLEYSFGRAEEKDTYAKKSLLNKQSSADTLIIPFFDDFANYTGNPDTTKWEIGGGALVNSGLGILPPSEGVITLDGLNEFGNPYDFRDNFPKGTADVLSSVPIDLSNSNVFENLYLSFFWQQGGFGEVPDAKQGDSLILEYKIRETDSTFRWRNIWMVRASDSLPNDALNFEIFPLDDTAYFYNSFQFRFRNKATLSGNYDNWHLDYVMLNSNRFQDDSSFLDRTIIKNQGRIFRDYTSIPASHIPQDSLYFYLKDTNSCFVRTLSRSFSTYRVRTIFKDDSSGVEIQNFTAPFARIIDGYLSLEPEIYPISENAVNNFNFDPRSQYYLSQSFILFDHDDTITDNIDRRVNDTATFRGTLGNFYAYDDGEPELGVGIRTPFGKVAVEYAPYKTDTLTALDIMFIPAEQTITNTQIGIRIWSDLQKDVDPVIYGQDIIGAYGPGRNTFYRVQFDSAVIISDTVFIGWVQFDQKFLNVGYDMNNVFNDKIYTKVDPSEGWVNEADFEFPGAIMIRPVFDTVKAPIAKGSVLEGPQNPDQPEQEEYQVRVYPNPSNGIISIDKECQSFSINDLNGKVILKGSYLKSGDRIDLNTLPNGTYLINFVNDGQIARERLLIFK